LMVGSLATIAVQNSCQKDVFDPPFGSRMNRTPGSSFSRDVRSLFFEVATTEKMEKTMYLVEKIRKNVRTNHIFLDELYRSEYCDEMHVYGCIRELKTEAMPTRKGKSRSEIIAHNSRRYEMAVYERTRIIKLPCNQHTARRIRTNFEMAKTGSGIRTATFDKNGGR